MSYSPYYFFDHLILADQSAFEFEIQSHGELCADNLRFELPHYDTLSYQWYKNGIALVGENNAALHNPPGDGDYHVVLGSTDGCVATEAFIYRVPFKTTGIRHTICEGEVFSFGNQELSTQGTYWDTLKTINNCDSIIKLDLTVDANVAVSVSNKIFPSESYNIGTYTFDSRGEYLETIPSNSGCDSTVNLTLEYYHIYAPNVFSPNGDGSNDFFTINGGSDLVQINNFQIFDRWGNKVFAKQELFLNNEREGWDGRYLNQEAATGVYLYNAYLVMDDGKERLYSGVITLVR